MKITDVRIKLFSDPQDRLRAFAWIVLDGCFVVRDLKVIAGAGGKLFVAMPSRRLMDHCPRCRTKNHLQSNYCNHCGAKLDPREAETTESRNSLYADIAHPINSECRDLIQTEIVSAYHREVERSREEGYVCRFEDFGRANDKINSDWGGGLPNGQVSYR